MVSQPNGTTKNVITSSSMILKGAGSWYFPRLSHTGEKLLMADWLRQRTFFLNHEATFGNQEDMIT